MTKSILENFCWKFLENVYEDLHLDVESFCPKNKTLNLCAIWRDNFCPNYFVKLVQEWNLKSCTSLRWCSHGVAGVRIRSAPGQCLWTLDHCCWWLRHEAVLGHADYCTQLLVVSTTGNNNIASTSSVHFISNIFGDNLKYFQES